jgi:hypothetical protein
VYDLRLLPANRYFQRLMFYRDFKDFPSDFQVPVGVVRIWPTCGPSKDSFNLATLCVFAIGCDVVSIALSAGVIYTEFIPCRSVSVQAKRYSKKSAKRTLCLFDIMIRVRSAPPTRSRRSQVNRWS